MKKIFAAVLFSLSSSALAGGSVGGSTGSGLTLEDVLNETMTIPAEDFTSITERLKSGERLALPVGSREMELKLFKMRVVTSDLSIELLPEVNSDAISDAD